MFYWRRCGSRVIPPEQGSCDAFHSSADSLCQSKPTTHNGKSPLFTLCVILILLDGNQNKVFIEMDLLISSDRKNADTFFAILFHCHPWRRTREKGKFPRKHLCRKKLFRKREKAILEILFFIVPPDCFLPGSVIKILARGLISGVKCSEICYRFASLPVHFASLPVRFTISSLHY